MLDLATKTAPPSPSDGFVLAAPGALTEVSGGALDGAAPAIALLACARPGKPVLWVQDRLSRLERGLPFPPGMARLLGFAPDLILVEARRPADALWVMEEALGARALAAVVGEVHGAPRALSFTATKRLALRAAASGIPALLVRSEPSGLSVAERWRAESRPSAPRRDDPAAPGAPNWDLKLTRPKGRAPGQWIASHDSTTHRLGLVPLLPDGALAPGAPGRRYAAG